MYEGHRSQMRTALFTYTYMEDYSKCCKIISLWKIILRMEDCIVSFKMFSKLHSVTKTEM